MNKDSISRLSEMLGISEAELAAKIKVPQSPGKAMLDEGNRRAGEFFETDSLDFAIEGVDDMNENSLPSYKDKKEHQRETDRLIEANKNSPIVKESRKRIKLRKKK